MELTIRETEQSDIPSLVMLEEKCFSFPCTQSQFQHELCDPNYYLITALANSDVAGNATMQVVLDEAYITTVAVDPNLRRRGIAETMLKKMIDVAKERGCAFLSLEVRSKNEAAKAIYSKLGFLEEGRMKNYYEAPKDDALIMTRRFSTNEDNGV